MIRWIAILTCGALVARAWPDGETPWVWWSMRSFGLVALLAAWFTMLFGVFVSGKGSTVQPPVVMLLHRSWATIAAVATLLHVAAAIADPRISPFAAVIPFASSTLRGPVAIGTVAMGMGSALYLSQRLPRIWWRAVHGTAFGGFLLALLHAVLAGTDTAALRFVYAGALAALLGAIIQRVALARVEAGPGGKRPAAQPT